MIVSADIGGTKTAIAYSDIESPTEFIDKRTYQSSEFESFDTLLQEFIKDISPERISLGIAAPIDGTKVTLTNLDWTIDKAAIEDRYGAEVIFLNDLQAAVWGLPKLGPAEYVELQKTTVQRGSDVLVGIGTGVGMARILSGNTVLPSEAGHIGFSPRTPFQEDFGRYVSRIHGHPSYEMIISSIGFKFIRKFMLQEQYFDFSEEFMNTLRSEKETPRLIHDRSKGTDDDAKFCQMILDEISIAVGGYLSDIALCHLPSTVAVTGGIGRNILNHKLILEYFNKNEAMEPLLQSIGLKIVTDEDIGLKGAAICGSRG
ncbi:MAG: glucokinase [Candidatus Kariarchaeaceae archaeon]